MRSTTKVHLWADRKVHNRYILYSRSLNSQFPKSKEATSFIIVVFENDKNGDEIPGRNLGNGLKERPEITNIYDA